MSFTFCRISEIVSSFKNYQYVDYLMQSLKYVIDETVNDRNFRMDFSSSIKMPEFKYARHRTTCTW